MIAATSQATPTSGEISPTFTLEVRIPEYVGRIISSFHFRGDVERYLALPSLTNTHLYYFKFIPSSKIHILTG